MKLSVGGIIRDAGNSVEKNNGNWTGLKPVIIDNAPDALVACPDSAIFKDFKGVFKVDYEFCKGCGLCARENPRSVDMVSEQK